MVKNTFPVAERGLPPLVQEEPVIEVVFPPPPLDAFPSETNFPDLAPGSNSKPRVKAFSKRSFVQYPIAFSFGLFPFEFPAVFLMNGCQKFLARL
jgi:hypothetical protein